MGVAPIIMLYGCKHLFNGHPYIHKYRQVHMSIEPYCFTVGTAEAESERSQIYLRYAAASGIKTLLKSRKISL